MKVISMKIVAITGSIGCGKTTIAKQIKELGYAVYDIDGWVRRIYYQKDFIKVIDKFYPGVVVEGRVDKRKLRNIVFNDNKKLKQLEALVHPFLKQTLRKVIHKNCFYDDLFFLDIALLFEMGWDRYCDVVIVADVDYATQKQRVMHRDKISAEDFDKINNVQMSNKDKIAKADIVINTDVEHNVLKVQLINLIDGIENG